MNVESLKDAILAEWDFCSESSEATSDARAAGMSERDICEALRLAGVEWAKSKAEVRSGL